MTIKEQIAALPDDESLKYGHCSECGYEFAGNSSDLKALADSHTHLLKAVRQWVKECRIEFSDEEIASDHEIQLFDAAILVAEKL